MLPSLLGTRSRLTSKQAHCCTSMPSPTVRHLLPGNISRLCVNFIGFWLWLPKSTSGMSDVFLTASHKMRSSTNTPVDRRPSPYPRRESLFACVHRYATTKSWNFELHQLKLTSRWVVGMRGMLYLIFCCSWWPWRRLTWLWSSGCRDSLQLPQGRCADFWHADQTDGVSHSKLPTLQIVCALWSQSVSLIGRLEGLWHITL